MNKQLFLNKLSKNKPSFFQQYNYDLLPDTFRPEDKISIECFRHGIFHQRVSSHLFGQGCPECGREKCDNNRALTTNEFIEKSRAKFGVKFSYEKTIYARKEAELTITCPYHGDFDIRANAHMWSRHGCPKCDFEIPRAIKKQKVLEKAKQTHSEKYDYSKVNYVNMNEPVEIICPQHGSFWQKPNSHISSRAGCCLCQDSKGERSIEECLKKYKISYIREYSLPTYRYRYDFFLPGLDIYIEFNGIQHYKPVSIFGGEQAFFKTRENDKIKKSLVKSFNGNLIVIPYTYLDKETVEKELTAALKRIYRYWFVIDGQIRVFKTMLDICSVFNISRDISNKDLIPMLEMTVPNFRVLF